MPELPFVTLTSRPTQSHLKEYDALDTEKGEGGRWSSGGKVGGDPRAGQLSVVSSRGDLSVVRSADFKKRQISSNRDLLSRDFSDLSDPQTIRDICRSRIPSWKPFAKCIRIEQIMAGLTNQLFIASINDEQAVLVAASQAQSPPISPIQIGLEGLDPVEVEDSALREPLHGGETVHGCAGPVPALFVSQPSEGRRSDHDRNWECYVESLEGSPAEITNHKWGANHDASQTLGEASQEAPKAFAACSRDETSGFASNMVRNSLSVEALEMATLPSNFCGPRKVLFRVYGSNVEDLYDSENELRIFKCLGAYKLAPQLLAEFRGGRIEEFIDGPALLCSEMRNPAVITTVASMLGNFHQLQDRVPELRAHMKNAADGDARDGDAQFAGQAGRQTREPLLTVYMRKWRASAEQAMRSSSGQSSGRVARRAQYAAAKAIANLNGQGGTGEASEDKALTDSLEALTLLSGLGVSPGQLTYDAWIHVARHMLKECEPLLAVIQARCQAVDAAAGTASPDGASSPRGGGGSGSSPRPRSPNLAVFVPNPCPPHSPDALDAQAPGNTNTTLPPAEPPDCGNPSAELVEKGCPLTRIVFSHNDLQENNILVENGNLHFIDYEYCGFNYAAFDIANFLCEMTIDYTYTQPPYFLHDQAIQNFPDDNVIRLFLSVYLSQVANLHIYPSDDTILPEKIGTVKVFVLASHLLWAVWAVIRAAHPNTSSDFDYISYALSRFHSYLNWRSHLVETGVIDWPEVLSAPQI